MDKSIIINTLLKAREIIFSVARDQIKDISGLPVYLATDLKSECWRDIESIDYLVEAIRKNDGLKHTAEKVTSEAITIAMTASKEIGRHRGMMQVLEERHNFIKLPYLNGFVSTEQLVSAGRDLWLMNHLLKGELNENYKQAGLPGRPGESSGGGPVQSGGVGLQCDAALETTESGGPGASPQG